MKRVILDFFRRWWWALAVIAVFQFRVGWSIANRPDDAFEFWVFLVAIWSGAMLLNLDLKRGIVRTVATLPLTARQIGRSWWLACIPIPALALGAILFSGAGAFHFFHPDTVFPARRLVLASLFVLPWLGTTFASIYGMTYEAIVGSHRERASLMFFSLLSMAMLFGGMLTLQDSTKQPVKFAVYLGAGALLIVAGWVRAEGFVLGRASFRLPALRPQNPRGPCRAPDGYGGMRFLISTTFVRAFLLITALVGLMALLMPWNGVKLPRELALAMFAGIGSMMSCGFIIVFQLLPVLRQLRFLRTLPISATRLTAALIAMMILPLITLGALVAGVAWLAMGIPAALTILNNYLFYLAPAALCVFFGVWRGDGLPTYALLVVTLFGGQQVQLRLQTFFQLRELPADLTVPIAATGILLAFLLARRALQNSSRACRIKATPLGNLS